MIIDTYYVEKILDRQPKVSRYSLDGKPDIVVLKVELRWEGTPVQSSEPKPMIVQTFVKFIDGGAKPLEVGDVIEEDATYPIGVGSYDEKGVKAVITGVELAEDLSHPNRKEKLYTIKTDTLPSILQVYGDASGQVVPQVGRDITVTLITGEEDVSAISDDFPEPIDEYTRISK
jgi:hypothetical protein